VRESRGSRALVIVDLQRGFVVPETAPSVPTIVRFIDRARDQYAVVIATRFINRPGSLYETERDWHAMMSGDEVDVLPEIARSADLVITKHGLAPDPEAFLLPLRERAVRTVDLCGFDTDQCVLATALLLWDAGFAPRLVAELCSSSGGPDMHEAGLAIARRAIGDRNVVPASGRPV
jgi:nicotinamidase-related amidase